MIEPVGERRRVGGLAPERQPFGRALVHIPRSVRIREFARERVAHVVADLSFEGGEPEREVRCFTSLTAGRRLRGSDFRGDQDERGDQHAGEKNAVHKALSPSAPPITNHGDKLGLSGVEAVHHSRQDPTRSIRCTLRTS